MAMTIIYDFTHATKLQYIINNILQLIFIILSFYYLTFP